MQVTVEDKSSVKKILHIEVPEADVVNELDAAYKQLKKTAKVKGFRPGKTPRPVLERMFKKDVQSDVMSRLIQDSLFKAIKEKDLALVGRPQVDPPELMDSGPYAFDAVVEVKPMLDDIDYKGLCLTKTMYKAGEKETRAQIEMFRKNLAQLKPIVDKRPAQQGDFVIIDYEGLKDGVPFDETKKTENFTMKLGGSAISKEFDLEIIGMNPEETKEFTIQFPENATNKKLANLTIEFKVRLKEIKEEVLPEADDELAKKLGNFQTLDELKGKIIDNVQQGYDKRIEQEMNEQIFNALISKQEFEVPDVMVEYEIASIIDEMERVFAYQNMSLEQLGQSKEMLAEKYRDTAIKQVKRHIILGKLIEQEALKISDEDLEEGYQSMSTSVSQPVEEIRNYYKENQENLDIFKHTLLEKKAIRLIIENSKIEEKDPEKTEAVESV
ncbi:MAG: trigger factor [Deltaproteobacteria bacterium]|nr:MAG: trigger factor [Deltaproteobacteria bacterium]